MLQVYFCGGSAFWMILFY